MKIKAKAAEECVTLFDIEIPKETIDKAFAEVYGDIQRSASIPGFRVGKAPVELVRKHYASNAREEVLKRLIGEAYRNALADHKIIPVSSPEIDDVRFEDGKPMSFKAKVETRPNFKLKEYKGIKLHRAKAVVGSEDAAKALENLQALNAKYIAVESRPIQMGDYAVSDLECFVEGKSIHKKRENIWIYLDNEGLVPGLHEKMVGMAKGDEREIEVVLPEKYPDAKAAGKKAAYRIKVKEIKSRQLPNIDDEFAKDLGKESLEKLREEISQELARRVKLNVEIDVENQLLKKVIDDNPFAVPPSFVKRQLEYFVENAKRRLEEKGFKRQDLDKKDGEFAQKLKDDAGRSVRLLFILNEIARREKIDVTDTDMEEAYRSIAAQTGRSEKEAKAYYEKEDIVDDLKDKVKEGKVIKFLLDHADIAEKE